MVISIPSPGGTLTFSVTVKEFEQDYKSGIEWEQVGDVWKSLDNGADTQKWTSDVTIAKYGETVAQIRSAMKYALRTGAHISIDCESHEQIFGPEIDYESAIECVVIATDEPLFTGNLNENNMVEWTFSIMPAIDLSERYLNDTGMIPAGIRMLSCSRLDNDGAITFDAEELGDSIGLGFYAPTAEIQYEGKLDDVAAAICYLQKLRGSSMSYSASIVWPFTQGVKAETVRVISVESDYALNKAGTMWAFTVLYAKA